MKKLILLISIGLVLTAASKPDEYRHFTNLEGKKIVARIVEYDDQSDRVLLELKNHRKAWIDLSSLSDEDQRYVREWTDGSAAETTEAQPTKVTEPVEPVSKKEMREIGDKYEEAIMKKDYALWKSLFFGIHRDSPQLDQAAFIQETRSYPTYISISSGTVKDCNVAIHINHQTHPYHATTEWLQLTPNGDIKYDIIMFRHPFEEACKWIPVLNGSQSTRIKIEALQRLKELGVPHFDYDIEGSKNECGRSLQKMIDWVLEQDPEWDVSEPKLALPKTRYKELVVRFKSLKNRL